MNLVLEDITVGYGKKAVVSGVNLELQPGRICALMGRNGSGKTTLLRCINAVLPPLNGRVMVMGKNISEYSRTRIARMISVVPQVSVSPFAFSCLDMVLMAGVSRLKSWGVPDETDKQAALAVMHEAGVGHMAATPFNTLSGGERQLVMLARALFQQAPIMLLDEPNAHLDFTNQHNVMALMRKLVKKRQLTVIITLHDPNLTHYYCDDVIMIHNGRVAAKGETRRTMTEPVLTAVLGDNIQCGTTRNGVFVVTPRQLNPDTMETVGPPDSPPDPPPDPSNREKQPPNRQR